jgi:hypothetical protein
VKDLEKELSKSIYTFIMRGEYPIWQSEREEMVEYGLGTFIHRKRDVLVESGVARFADERTDPDVLVEEPIALISILRHFGQAGRIAHDIVGDTLEDNQGAAFQEAVLLGLTRIFRNGRRLDEAFKFQGETPDWARQSALIVTKNNGTLEEFDIDIASAHPAVPSVGIAVYANSPKDIENWFKSMRPGWCLPSKYMGPDLMAWLRLADGKLLLLLLQAKCYLSGNKDGTLSAAVTAHAIGSLDYKKFFSSLVRT